jgi:hypothetical protein
MGGGEIWREKEGIRRRCMMEMWKCRDNEGEWIMSDVVKSYNMTTSSFIVVVELPLFNHW